MNDYTIFKNLDIPCTQLSNHSKTCKVKQKFVDVVAVNDRELSLQGLIQRLIKGKLMSNLLRSSKILKCIFHILITSLLVSSCIGWEKKFGDPEIYKYESEWYEFLFFFLGIVIVIYLYRYFRNLRQNMYAKKTNNNRQRKTPENSNRADYEVNSYEDKDDEMDCGIEEDVMMGK